MKKRNIFIYLLFIILLTNINTLAQKCMFITVADTLKDTEINLAQKFGEWGYDITVVCADSLPNFTTDDYVKYDFAFGSESINSSRLTPLKLMPIPLVTTEAWASKPAALAWSDPASAANIPPEQVLIVDNTDHPLAARYKAGDLVDLVTDAAGLMISTYPTIDVIPIGASSSNQDNSIIYGIEAGTELTDGDITENRAVCIGIHEFGYSSMTDAAFEFIHAAINWVLGINTKVNEKNTGIPEDFNLAQNFPNPFNPVTVIQFSIVKRAYTNLTVYNTLGQTVKTLIDEDINAGTYQVTFDAATIPSGVYFYRIHSGGAEKVCKMILMK